MQGKQLIIILLLVAGVYVQAGEEKHGISSSTHGVPGGNEPTPKPRPLSASGLFLEIFDKYQQMQPALRELDLPVFMNAYLGFLNLNVSGLAESPVLTIVDFKKPSTQPRMWILDLEKDSLLLHTWVAHGKGSGLEKAETFSNTPESLQTSLGFYLTAEEYIGKNGRSLRLDGLDEGFNTNARKRHVVLHGADYVSMDIIAEKGFLGNSEGCPAVSREVNDQVINWVRGRSVLFITGNAEGYHSQWLDPQLFLSLSLHTR